MNPYYRLQEARNALNHSVWMLAVPLLLGLASCGMAVNLQIQTALAEEAIVEALKDQPPIYLLDDKQCAAHRYQGDVVCAASWWEPAEEGGYNPAGLVQIFEIAENAESGLLIIGGLPLILIFFVIGNIRKTRRILRTEESGW